MPGGDSSSLFNKLSSRDEDGVLQAEAEDLQGKLWVV
jgi:hypothetical protein